MPAHLEESNTTVPILAPGTAEAALAVAERFGQNRCPYTAGTVDAAGAAPAARLQSSVTWKRHHVVK